MPAFQCKIYIQTEIQNQYQLATGDPDMKAVILAGGKGTRLRPYTTCIPKPLMPIGDMPVLEVLLRQLKRDGFDEVVITVGYLSELIRAFFQDGSRLGIKITYSFEEKPLGTAGPLSQLIDELSDDFLLLNGDLLTTLNYRKMLEFHRANKAAATIGLYQRDVRIDFGVIETDGQSRLTNYIEKPTYHFDVSMGVNVLSADAVKKHLVPGVRLDVPELMENLRRDGGRVLCYKEDCFWLDIGRIDDYEIAAEEFEKRRKEFLG